MRSALVRKQRSREPFHGCLAGRRGGLEIVRLGAALVLVAAAAAAIVARILQAVLGLLPRATGRWLVATLGVERAGSVDPDAPRGARGRVRGVGRPEPLARRATSV